MKIVNKRPRNLLKEIQNVFINGKQVKTDKITQIIPRFSQFYAKTTIGNSHAHMYAPLHDWQHLPTELSGCDQLAGDVKVGPGDISKF